MSITSGTYTVGGAGADYPGTTGLDDAITDIAAAIGGDITLDVTGNVNWSVFLQKQFNAHKIKITTSNHHNGNPNAGYVITLLNDVVVSTARHEAAYWGSFELEYLQLRNHTFYPTDYSPTGVASKLHVTIHHCIFISCAMAPSHFNGNWLYYANILHSFNMWHEGSAGNVVFENNTAYDSIGMRPWNLYCEYLNFILRNNHAGRLLISGWPLPANEYMPLGYNNSSIDNSAETFGWRTGSSGNVGNIVAVDEFKSTTSTNSDYLFLKDNAVGVLADGGATPAYATTDIAGLEIPYVGNYPIGCHVSVYSTAFGVGYDFAVDVGDVAAGGGVGMEFAVDVGDMAAGGGVGMEFAVEE